MKYDILSALISLKPNGNYSYDPEVGGYGGITYRDSDTCPTESELNTELTRLNSSEAMRLLREERDLRLSACDWRANSDLTLSDSWKTYRQALRDMPASASPKVNSDGELDMTSVTFPTEPS